MEKVKVDWTENEFKAYLLLYIANSNFVETDEERDLIIDKVNAEAYKKMHRIIDKDNDYQRVQKINYCVEKFCYTHDELDILKDEMQSVIDADGYHDEAEHVVFMGLRKLLTA